VRRRVPLWTISIASIGLAVALWALAIRLAGRTLLPGPVAVGSALIELVVSGRLVRFAVASLFRVTWGFSAAVVVAIPLGLLLGWFTRGERTVGPILQLLRPISPLAWTPLAILWFGVGDLASVYLIFVASFLPLSLSAIQAVRGVHPVHVDAAKNLGLGNLSLIRRVLFPAALPQLIVGVRLTLGVAWLVVVAAEMLAVNSGLGFLIIDARNAGDRYDMVVAGMVTIGAIGLALDSGIRMLERGPTLGWREGAR
jgi:NitT/TauT family transport system permease protein